MQHSKYEKSLIGGCLLSHAGEFLIGQECAKNAGRELNALLSILEKILIVLLCREKWICWIRVTEHCSLD